MEILGLTEAAFWEVELAKRMPTFALHSKLARFLAHAMYQRSPHLLAVMLGALVAILSPVCVPAFSGLGSEAIAATTSCTTVLKRGDTGAAVQQMQTALKNKGYFLTPDGTFGEQTEIILKTFQRTNNLDPDGVYGLQTCRLLTQTSPATGNAGTTSNTAPLSLGMQGDRVTKLQEQLRKLGYANVAWTGKFDTQTDIAVRQFQAAQNITVDGIVGSGTQSRLDQAIAKLTPTTPPPSSTTPTGLKLGSRDSNVLILQDQLRRLGYTNVASTGTFDAATDIAVRQFQLAQGLPVDGVVGSATQTRLNQEIIKLNASSANPVVTPVPAPIPPQIPAIPVTQPVVSEYRYIVAVPSSSATTLAEVRQLIPQAQLQNSRRGQYVHAGSYQNRASAESMSYNLRSRGLDARVISD